MSELKRTASRRILIFLGINFLFSSVFYFLIIKTKLDGGGGLYVRALMWCPGLSALLTCRLVQKSLSELGWKWGNTKYQVWSYLIPIAYALTAYIGTWVSGYGEFYNHEFVKKVAASFGWNQLSPGIVIALYVVLAGTYGMISSSSSALGEEIGWRGFLVPELSKITNFTGTALISGLIWSVWHYPLLIFANYNAGTPVWYGITCFTVMVISISFIFAWMRLKSGSLWTGVFLHASHNLFIQSILTPLTKDTGKTAYVIDEFGLALPLVSIFFAFFFWKKRTFVVATLVAKDSE
jgi:membrane protease YdiL (CAAX protease family)